MTALTHAISAALLHFIWQGMAVAFLLWIVLAALRNSSASLRYFVSCAALVVLIALPVVTVWVVYRGPAAVSTAASQAPDIPHSTDPAAFSRGASLPVWIAAVQTWVLPVWFAGVMIFATRLIWSSRHAARLQREGDPAEASLIAIVSRLARRMKIDQPVRVLLSRLTDSPSVAGWIRPVILLPSATVLNLTVEQLEAVLAHELAHIRRQDYLVNVLQTMTETLLFYQPAVWWISSRIRDERELCCDDLAVETCGDPVGYARALAKLERLRVTSPELAMSSTAGPLLYRIQRLTGTVQEQPPSKAPAILALGLALFCLMTNLDWAYAQPQASEAVVRREAIWVEAVKYGDLPIMVRALGTITTASTAELKVPAPQAADLQIGQDATIQLRRGIAIAGKVIRIGPNVVNGIVTVAVQLQAPVTEFTGEEVDGIIRIKVLNDTVYINRPAVDSSSNESFLFKIDPDGNHATRRKVRLGAASVSQVQVLEGLQPGERVILSDTSKYDRFERIRLE